MHVFLCCRFALFVAVVVVVVVVFCCCCLFALVEERAEAKFVPNTRQADRQTDRQIFSLSKLVPNSREANPSSLRLSCWERRELSLCFLQCLSLINQRKYILVLCFNGSLLADNVVYITITPCWLL